MINNVESTSATSHYSTIQEMNGTFNILEIFYPDKPSKIEYVLFTDTEDHRIYKLDINQDARFLEHMVGKQVKIKGFQTNVNANSASFNKNIPNSSINSIINADMKINVFEIKLIN